MASNSRFILIACKLPREFEADDEGRTSTDVPNSSVFRSLLSIAQSPSQRDPIILTDLLIEHSWILESLLDAVYELEVTCLNDYRRARAVVDLAEKWCFGHVVKLIKQHFQLGKCDGSGMSSERLAFALALKDQVQANACLEAWHASRWSAGEAAVRPGDLGILLRASEPYLYDEPVPDLLGYSTIIGAEIFDLGTWDYRLFLQLRPSAIWAILRAREKATTSESVVDGAVFQDECAKLLRIIMAVSNM